MAEVDKKEAGDNSTAISVSVQIIPVQPNMVIRPNWDKNLTSDKNFGICVNCDTIHLWSNCKIDITMTSTSQIGSDRKLNHVVSCRLKT